MAASVDPFVQDLVARLRATLADDDFQKRLVEITNSRTWKRIVEFLCARREQLYTQVPPTSFAMAQRDGALAEIQRLILHGPKLLLMAQTQQESSLSPSLGGASLVPSLPADDDGLG